MGLLVEYAWPGNVRELENLIERLDIMADGPEIDLRNLPAYLSQGSRQIKLEERSLSRLEEMEREELAIALERSDWVRSRAARELRLSLRQIGYRVKKYGLGRLAEERHARTVSRRFGQ